MPYPGSGDSLVDSSPTWVIGEVMLAVVGVIVLIVVFLILLHLLAKRIWHGSFSFGSRRFVFASDAAATLAPCQGLDPSIIRSLPVLVFHCAEFKDGLECTVCLCEISEGEKTRLLPGCNHGFHLDCIDMWLQSHSTCPLCRNPLAVDPCPKETQTVDRTTTDGQLHESPHFPTNVLFWGSQDHVSTRRMSPDQGSSSSSKDAGGNGRLLIEIPKRMTEGLTVPSCPSSVRGRESDTKSPSARLRYLSRFLSRDKTPVLPFSTTGGDIEQGFSGNILNSSVQTNS